MLTVLLAVTAIALTSLLSPVSTTPAHAESKAAWAFRLTGEVIAKRDRWVTLTVASVERFDARDDAPAPGDVTEVRIGFGTRFLEVGKTYTMPVFIHDDGLTSRIAVVRNADGSSIDTGLLRRREFQVGLGIAGAVLLGLAGYAIIRLRHPRRPAWRL